MFYIRVKTFLESVIRLPLQFRSKPGSEVGEEVLKIIGPKKHKRCFLIFFILLSKTETFHFSSSISPRKRNSEKKK